MWRELAEDGSVAMHIGLYSVFHDELHAMS